MNTKRSEFAMKKIASIAAILSGILLLAGCGQQQGAKQTTPTPSIPKPSTHVGPLVNAKYDANCGSATYQPGGPTPSPITLSPGQTLPPIATPSGATTVSELVSLVHEILNQQGNISAKGAISCLPPQLVDESLVSQYVNGVPHIPSKVWVVIVQGNFTVTSVGSSSQGNPVKYIVYFLSAQQPITVYSSYMFGSTLPSPLNRL